MLAIGWGSALDVGAREINEDMKAAAAEAIASLARVKASDVAASAYAGSRALGPRLDHSQPFGQRLILQIAPAVARAVLCCAVLCASEAADKSVSTARQGR